MKALQFAHRRTLFTLAGGALAAVIACLALGSAGSGCVGGQEGVRCNPDLAQSGNECNAGLTCQQPSTCAETYCCPTPASASESGYCNGAYCPVPGAGSTEGDPCKFALVSIEDDQCSATAGLTCQQSAKCGGSFCCSTPANMSTVGVCNGTSCPSADGGSPDGG